MYPTNDLNREHFPHRMIFCAYKNFAVIKARFPTREVVPEGACPDDQFFVIRKHKKGVFMVHVSDWSIWKPSQDPWTFTFERWPSRRGPRTSKP